MHEFPISYSHTECYNLFSRGEMSLLWRSFAYQNLIMLLLIDVLNSLGNSSTASENSDPGGYGSLTLQLGRRYFSFSCPLYFLPYNHASLLPLFLCFILFSLLVHEFHFFYYIPNGTCFLPKQIGFCLGRSFVCQKLNDNNNCVF